MVGDAAYWRIIREVRAASPPPKLRGFHWGKYGECGLWLASVSRRRFLCGTGWAWGTGRGLGPYVYLALWRFRFRLARA